MKWELWIVGVNCVGAPEYLLGEIEGSEEEGGKILTQLLDKPRPAAVAFGVGPFIWLREGDALVLHRKKEGGASRDRLSVSRALSPVRPCR